MDGKREAVQRMIRGKQDMTFYMDLHQLASTAIQEAYHLAKKQPVTVNADYGNKSETLISTNLITGQLITKENIDRILIDSGYLTHTEVYNSTK